MKLPIDVFSDWANDGRDERMADGHANSVKAMLDVALKGQTNPFTFIDAGCGNGWVVRMMGQHSLCESAIGVDGSESMIEKARVNDLLDWIPKEKVDLVHSMEVFYYMEDPIGLIKSVAKYWLNPGGRLILGIDYYSENKISESWNEDCGISIMTRMSESEWIDGFRQAGLMNIQSWRQGEKEGWAGTLVVSGVN